MKRPEPPRKSIKSVFYDPETQKVLASKFYVHPKCTESFKKMKFYNT